MPSPSNAKSSRKLTTKQRKFVKAKAEGKTGVAAAMEAYGVDYRTAGVMAAQNLEKLSIQEALEKEFAKQGITLERIVRPISDALDANTQDNRPDHGIRLRATGIAAQFMGINKQPTVEGGIHFHQHIDAQKEKYNI